MGSKMTNELELQLKGYGLTTAQILYRMPDHPSFLQTYIWQHYDIAPDFPEMKQLPQILAGDSWTVRCIRCATCTGS